MEGGGNDPDASGQLSVHAALQHLASEYAQFERARLAWAQERAELMQKIGALEGIRRGEASLKRDLLLRIKMLEHALIQERSKQSGATPAPAPTRSVDNSATAHSSSPTTPAASAGRRSVREAREVLVQYLSELGYDDALIKSQGMRMKGLLDSWTTTGAGDIPTDATLAAVAAATARQQPQISATAAAAAAKEEEALEAAEAEMGEEEREEVSEEEEETSAEGDALAALDFLGDLEQEAEAALAEADSSPTAPSEAASDEAELTRKMKDTFGTAGAKLLKKTKRRSGVKNLFPTGSNESVMDAEASSADLGGLANVTAALAQAQAPTYSDDTLTAPRKAWKAKTCLKSHLDSVRAICFVPDRPLMISGGEDETVKLWHLPKVNSTSTQYDMSPIKTLRGHSGAVLAVACTATASTIYSAGKDMVIRSWDIPDAYTGETGTEYSSLAGKYTFEGHTDAVWSLAVHPIGEHLVSGSADGTCRIWNTSTGAQEAIMTGKAAVTKVDFLPSDPSKVAVGFSNGTISLVNITDGSEVFEFEPEKGAGAILDFALHKTVPTALVACESNQLLFYSTETGVLQNSMVGHETAVTGVAYDSNGLYFVSVGHDRSVRVWDALERTMRDESTTHKSKFDEAIHAVSWHPSLAMFASAGADGTVWVFS